MRHTCMRSEFKKKKERRGGKKKRTERKRRMMDGGGYLLIGAAGGFDWDTGQSGGPAEHVGTVWSLLDKLWSSLNK